MKRYCALIKSFFSYFLPSKAEYEKYLDANCLSVNQIKYILKIIDEEVVVSSDFGLVLRKEDLAREKLSIIAVFNKWGQTLNRTGPTWSCHEYTQALNDLLSLVSKLLESEIKFHFDNAPSGQIKNRYNCHLSSLVSRLFRDFVDNKCIFYMDFHE